MKDHGPGGFAPALNDLPDVVDGPGEYVTRDGRRVTIHEVKSPSAPDTTAFGASGAIWKDYRGSERPRGFGLWHASGRSMPLEERPSDIVGRWQQPAEVQDAAEPDPEDGCGAPRFR